jgi:hypothetical protein
MMRGHVALGAIAVLCAGCVGGDRPGPTETLRVPLFTSGSNAGGNADINLGTHLTGAEEVLIVPEGAPHPSDSRAQGEAIFRVNDDGTVDFKLIASNINNVIMAHIHCGPAGSNGPVRMWLHPVIGPAGASLTPPGIREQNGVLAEGTFTLGSVTCPSGMALLEAMRAGLTYVNVHTNDGVAPGNTGPGDFPGGEIRGQIDHGR